MPEKGQVVLSDIKKIEFGKVVNKIVDVWLFDYDGEVDLDNATTDEVAQVAWMNREQIKELFDANMFVDTLEYFFILNFIDCFQRFHFYSTNSRQLRMIFLWKRWLRMH